VDHHVAVGFSQAAQITSYKLSKFMAHTVDHGLAFVAFSAAIRGAAVARILYLPKNNFFTTSN